jgi:isoquinoline 1-oxidoreductase subunit beta
MLFGTVLMSPVFWREPVSYDLTAARAMPGVVAVVPISSINGHGFGVIAQNTWAAFKAAKAIEVEWAAPDYPADGAAIEAALDAALDGDASSVMRSNGDVEVAFAASEGGEVLEATYKVPLLAHACMEPMNATARIAEGRLEIWAPNQMPTITAQVCGAAVGIEDVVVHTTQMGGAFGRREVDFSLYAALLAREVEGRPVKVTWSREEDIRHDMYRPPAKARMRARMGTDGLPQAVEIDIAAPSIIQSILRRTFPSLPVGGPDASITQGASDQPYTIENYRVSGRKAELGIPVGFWRSVGNSFNGYFHESFMDEIAHRGGTDPIELRRRLMADHPEAIAVIDAVAEMSGWSQPPAQGRARGFAFVLSFGSWVAEVVEVSQSPQGIRIEDVWIAADVGLALDPRNIEAQLVSGAVYGLSAAMDEEITLAGGMVEQSNFHDFDAMRMHRCPRFHTRILQNQARMGGVGEIGTPPAAPALANAVFALTGRRVRSLPLSREVRFA